MERLDRSLRLHAALENAWGNMAEDYGLFPDLAADAVLARVDRGEIEAATPRLLQLLVSHDLPIEVAADVVTRLGDHPWPTEKLTTVQEVLDAWWLEVLMHEPGEHPERYPPETVLGVLSGYDAPMIRWFEPWIGELDGPGAIHLAAIVVMGRDRLTAAAWSGKEDRADQVFGWARTETVINGLALVGGTHLGDQLLSDVLEKLI